MRRPKPKGARAFGELMGYLTSSLFFLLSPPHEEPRDQQASLSWIQVVLSFPLILFFPIHSLFSHLIFICYLTFIFFQLILLFSHLIFTCYLTIIQHYKFTQQHAEYHLNTFIFLFHTHGNARGIHLVLYKRTHVDPMSPLHETEPIEFG